MKKWIPLTLALVACSSQASLEERAANYLSCSDGRIFIREESKTKDVDYFDREMGKCRSLKKFMLENAVSDCTDSFYNSSLSDDTNQSFIDRCLSNWLEREELKISKEYLLYRDKQETE
jgi:hypothetical protein